MPSPQRKRKVTPFTTLLNFVPYKKPLNYVHSDLKQSTKSSTKSGSNQPTYRQILSDHNYSLIKSLGSGSYSKVKLAQNSNKTSLKVAVKIVNLSKAPGDFLKRFLPRELEIWPKIEHQNIIRFFDSFEDSGYVYMILEYASNGDMLTYIQKYGPIPEIQSRGIANQVKLQLKVRCFITLSRSKANQRKISTHLQKTTSRPDSKSSKNASSDILLCKVAISKAIMLKLRFVKRPNISTTKTSHIEILSWRIFS
ncbi:spermatozoon-associated protein kinase isoform X2 [Octopus bimaculoides]|uniref:spermatozoon-associated protein kinase isoform X2 n=1 Tax=Octopus bimaculoides TaxID=37653 RepID=UPI00071C8781|nr:spermatozoon-associated protein kinase isoform X2 [Octopus bimaculoides]|eukprot:XP_014781322.1 PREDICTED: spermatozoon-associated protein kinase-like isoform X2 [Octopus bimaculoides]